MGYLWANMEKIDVQASEAEKNQVKAELADAKAELAETKAELSGTKVKLTVAENRAQDAEAENARLKALLAANGIVITES